MVGWTEKGRLSNGNCLPLLGAHGTVEGFVAAGVALYWPGRALDMSVLRLVAPVRIGLPGGVSQVMELCRDLWCGPLPSWPYPIQKGTSPCGCLRVERLWSSIR